MPFYFRVAVLVTGHLLLNSSVLQVKESSMSFLKIPAWLSTIKLLPTRSKPNHKTHDYTQSHGGDDYIFDPIEEGNGGYLTGQGRGIERGDYLILSDGSHCHRYQVEEIDYYSNPPDMWIALVKKSYN